MEYVDMVLNLEWNGWIAFMLYWLPLGFNAYGYTVRTAINYRADLKARNESRQDAKKWYVPTDTLGALIGRGLATTLPGVNLLAAVFDLAPEVFGRFFSWIGKVFDQPLVPKDKKE